MTRHSVIHLSQQTFNEVAQSAEHIAHIELYIIMKSRSIYVDNGVIGLSFLLIGIILYPPYRNNNSN